MSKTLGQNFQHVNDLGLKSLGQPERTTNAEIFGAIERELESPLRIHASFPAADSLLNFSQSILTTADGAKRVAAPVKKQVFNIQSSSIDFQTKTLSNPALFDIEWPVTNTVGMFRRVAFSLIGSGKIKALFSPESSTLGGLVNAGSLLVNGAAPVGYIDLACTNTAGYFKTATSSSNIIESGSIYRFGSGAGGGSGTGDANQFTENLKHRLHDSFFHYLTATVFEIDEASEVQSTTGTYDLVAGVYKLDAGQNLLTKSMFNIDFLGSIDDSMNCEVYLEWSDEASLDTSALVEASLDGTSFEAVAMSQQGKSFVTAGEIKFNAPASATLATFNSGLPSGGRTFQGTYSVSYPGTITDKSKVRAVTVGIQKDGSPEGSARIQLKSGTNVLYTKFIQLNSLSSGSNLIDLDIVNILPPGSYSVLIETDSTYFSTSGTPGKRIIVDEAALLKGFKYDLRVRVQSSAADKKLKALGVLYSEQAGGGIQGNIAQETKTFSGDLNQNSFTITNFLPDIYMLKVYDIKTAQVYRKGAFSVEGRTITFPAGTFNAPGQTIELLFDQSEGSGYDYSDRNSSLLSSNHLGSPDSFIDRSVSGRGLYLRDSSSVLREIALDGKNSLAVYDTSGVKIATLVKRVPGINVGTDLNWDLGNVFYKDISANTTFTFSNVNDGQVITFAVRNTSGASVTITLPSGLYKDASLDLVVDPGKENVYTFISSNNKTYVSFVSKMSNV